MHLESSEDGTLSSTPSAHDDTSLDTAADELLMLAAVKLAPEFSHAAHEMAVWDKIAGLSRGRYHTGSEVRHHIYGLVQAVQDQAHPQHGELHPILRALVARFVDRTDEDLGFTGPNTRSRTPSETVQPQAKMPRKISTEQVGRVRIRPRGDALLVGFVLEKRLFSASPTDAQHRWNEVATALTRGYPSIVDGSTARARFKNILNVFNDASHPNHNDLTDELKQQLAQYNQLVASFRAKLKVIKETMLRNDDASADEDLVLTKPRALGEGADLPASESRQASIAGVESEETESKPRRQTRKRRAISNNNSQALPLDADADELLMRVLLEKRPFAVERHDRVAVWKDVVTAVKRTNPRISDATSASGRVRTLLYIKHTPSHPEFDCLTHTLKGMLTKFEQLKMQHRELGADAERLAKVAKSKKRTRATGTHPDGTNRLRKKRRRDAAGGDETAVTTPMTEHERRIWNDTLLREVLRTRPFRGHCLDSKAAWDAVATAVNQALGSHLFQNGDHAMGRFKRLRVAFHGASSGPDQSRFTSRQREMLRLVDELKKITWPKASKWLTDKHQELERRIRYFVEETSPEESVGTGVIHARNTTAEPSPTSLSVESLSSCSSDADPTDDHDAQPVMQIVSRTRGRGRTTETKPLAPLPTSTRDRMRDEVWLHEILRAQPIDGDRPEDQVASAMSQVLGCQMAPTTTRALSRIQSLPAVIKPSASAPVRVLSRLPGEVLNPNDELEETKRSKKSKGRTDDQENRQMRAHGISKNTATEVFSASSSIPDDEEDGEQFPLMQIVSRSEQELVQMRQKLTQVKTQCDALRAELAQRGDVGVQAKVHQEQLTLLRDDVIRLCSTAASERALFETHVESLESEVASYRQQLEAQAARSAVERRVHHDKLHAMMEMLQSERAAHERGTAAMLELVHRERENRREEFAAMMNLVTRSVLPRDARSTV